LPLQHIVKGQALLKQVIKRKWKSLQLNKVNVKLLTCFNCQLIQKQDEVNCILITCWEFLLKGMKFIKCIPNFL
jgi:hypothetical protein